MSWGGSGWRGILSNLPFGSYSLRAGPQTGFSGWGAGSQVRSGDALAGSCWLSQLQRGRVTKVGGRNHPFFWDSRVLGPEYSCLCVHLGHGLWRTGPLRYGRLPGSAVSSEIAVACKKRKATPRGFCQGLGRARMAGKLRLVGGDGGSRPRGGVHRGPGTAALGEAEGCGCQGVCEPPGSSGELGRGTLGKTSRETGGVATNPIQQRWAQSAWLSNHC